MRTPLFATCLPLLAVAAGCGDSVHPPPQGAWVVTFLDEGPNGSQGCGVTGHNAKIGEVSDTTRPTVLADGQEGADVSCSVVGTSSFSVSARALMGATNLEVAISALTSGATEDNPAKGQVAFASPTTVDTFQSTKDAPCNFYMTQSSQGVGPGHLWVAFDCPAVEVDAQNVCKLGSPANKIHNFILFENCAGAAESDD